MYYNVVTTIIILLLRTMLWDIIMFIIRDVIIYAAAPEACAAMDSMDKTMANANNRARLI